MKKFISFVFALIIVIALLFMGIMEKTLSGVGGNKGIIIFYIILGTILLIMYLKAKKATDAEHKKNKNIENHELIDSEEDEINADKQDSENQN